MELATGFVGVELKPRAHLDMQANRRPLESKFKLVGWAHRDPIARGWTSSSPGDSHSSIVDAQSSASEIHFMRLKTLEWG